MTPLHTRLLHAVIALLCFSNLPTWAHEGHGMDGAAHYHATDAWGFIVMAAIMAVVWWFTGRGK
jgi:hypothetical protein